MGTFNLEPLGQAQREREGKRVLKSTAGGIGVNEADSGNQHQRLEKDCGFCMSSSR